MKHVIKGQLLEYLKYNDLISEHQHGYLARYSTFTELIECVDDRTLALNISNSVDVAYLDFSKAFDSVSHSKLILKLQSFGIGGKLLDWVNNYLITGWFRQAV